jgi:hypothetical protein
MQSLFLRIVCLFLALPAASAFAQTPIPCVTHANLQKISQSFSQFQQFVGNKTEYCEADLGAQNLKIANSLAILIDAQPNMPAIDTDDALTFQAIAESNWWAYFTARASTITAQAQCPQGVGAFVMPFFGDGNVHVCPLFFDLSVYTQASIMMHEVRHFDGFAHVTCTQGFEKGSAGACDDKITTKGSYAVGLQVMVGMARSAIVDPLQKPGMEAESIYDAFNKFNEVPKVKLNTAVILANNAGEVYKWDTAQEAKLLGTLSEPAVVSGNNLSLTIYPLNKASDAYRKDIALQTDIPSVGAFATKYNSETPDERAKYKSIQYIGLGGMLKGNSLISLCGTVPQVKETNLDNQGQFSAIISLSGDTADLFRDSYLLAENGDLVKFDCEDNATTDAVKFEKSEMKISLGGNKIVSSFGLFGLQYALLDNGSLTVLATTNNTLSVQALSLPVDNKGWVSAVPVSKAQVF